MTPLTEYILAGAASESGILKRFEESPADELAKVRIPSKLLAALNRRNLSPNERLKAINRLAAKLERNKRKVGRLRSSRGTLGRPSRPSKGMLLGGMA